MIISLALDSGKPYDVREKSDVTAPIVPYPKNGGKKCGKNGGKNGRKKTRGQNANSIKKN